MKAMRIRQPASFDSIYADEAPAREPGPGEIRVRLRAASLNFRDLMVATGYFPAADGLIPLSDGAGEVIAVGAGVAEFAPGDAVVSTFHPAWQDGHIEKAQMVGGPGGPADGFACEEATRPATHFTHAPRGLSHAESATITCAGVTAWRALFTDGQLQSGQTVLVLGTGGVSIYALQLAKAAGARVIATSSSPERIARLHALGADHAIDYRADPEWGQTVLGLTGGLGVDHVIEVGGPNTLPQSIAAARTGAHLSIIGAVGGFDGNIPFIPVQFKRLRLQGVTVGSRADQIALVRAMETSGIRPVIDRSFALGELAAAFRHLQAGRHFGKVALEM
jgi:NADPH:quinone reductase-like Zn-dependent oxidoreductase